MAKVPAVHFEFPEDLHRKVKAQAALEGKTLKQYVLDTLAAAVTEKKPKPKR